MSTNIHGIILPWQLETFSVNEKFTRSTGHGYQEVIDGTPAVSRWARAKEISSNQFVQYSCKTLYMFKIWMTKIGEF